MYVHIYFYSKFSMQMQKKTPMRFFGLKIYYFKFIFPIRDLGLKIKELFVIKFFEIKKK